MFDFGFINFGTRNAREHRALYIDRFESVLKFTHLSAFSFLRLNNLPPKAFWLLMQKNAVASPYACRCMPMTDVVLFIRISNSPQTLWQMFNMHVTNIESNFANDSCHFALATNGIMCEVCKFCEIFSLIRINSVRYYQRKWQNFFKKYTFTLPVGLKLNRTVHHGFEGFVDLHLNLVNEKNVERDVASKRVSSWLIVLFIELISNRKIFRT